jgi:hypothetical protein
MSSDELKALAMAGDFGKVTLLAKSNSVLDRVIDW